MSEVALTKLDVLDPLETVKVCVAYEVDGRRIEHWPDSQSVLHKVKPIYEELPGWRTDLSAATEAHHLPRGRHPLRRAAAGSGRRARSTSSASAPHATSTSTSEADPATVRAVRVVVVGGDGRAHALAHVLGRSCDGRRGQRRERRDPDAVDTPPEELDGDLFVISPEAPLVDGLADRLRAQGKRVYGPGADGARLEGSKAYMKRLVEEAGVPTARHGAFDDAGAGARASCGRSRRRTS